MVDAVVELVVDAVDIIQEDQSEKEYNLIGVVQLTSAVPRFLGLPFLLLRLCSFSCGFCCGINILYTLKTL